MPNIATLCCLIAALGAGAPVSALPTQEVDASPAEVERVRIALEEIQSGPVDVQASPEYGALRERLWTLLERRTLAVLGANPAADADELAAGLLGAAGEDWLSLTAERLDATGTVVVACDAGLLGGTFFVAGPVASSPDHFRVLWTIRPLAAANFAARNEFGRWAFAVPGFHDGPLGGRVLPLPATGSGRPRFLVDAIAHAEMGLTVPGQIGIWEWTGTEAKAELIEAYQTTADLHEVQREGMRLRIATKEDGEVAYACGSCDEPTGVWTLLLRPDGVRDLGHASEEPLLKPTLDLLASVARGEDTSGVAAPDVGARLGDWARRLRGAWQDEQEERDRQDGRDTAAPEAADPYAGLRSMLEGWRVNGTGARRTIDLATDDWRVVLTFEERDGAVFAVAVEFPAVEAE